jgi:hypothetical protein
MDTMLFSAVTRTLTEMPSRRDVLRGLGAAGLGLGALRLPDLAIAKKKRKRKKKGKKAKPNEYGCLEVGDPCKVAEQCCSGICEGKKGKRKCQAHGIGTCEQDKPGLCEAGNPLSTICNGAACLCVRTTSGSNYCGTLLMPSACADCKKDTDCEAQGFPPGTACVPFGGEFTCAGQCEETGMVCLVPCGTPLPEG